MCTLYSQVKAQAEIRALINAIYDTAGNLARSPRFSPARLRRSCARLTKAAN